MNRLLLHLVVLAFVAAPLTGCIENMRDLKDKLQPAAETALTDTGVETAPPVVNATNKTPPKPPVARMTIFGANNALVFKATFVGEDVATPVFVAPNVELTLLGADSEAVESGATIASYSWLANGKATEGQKATTTFEKPGLYPIVLTVTDSKGTTDSQTVAIAVAPEPYSVDTPLKSSAVAGADGAGQIGTAAYKLTTANEPTPARIMGFRVTALPNLTCDHMLEVQDADGGTVGGPTDSAGPNEAEELNLGTLPEGEYSILVSPFACVAPEGVDLVVTVTYLPVVPELEGVADDGHGGHAH